jgi:hypothetical protein
MLCTGSIHCRLYNLFMEVFILLKDTMREQFSNKNDNVIYGLVPPTLYASLQFLECYLYHAFLSLTFC